MSAERWILMMGLPLLVASNVPAESRPGPPGLDLAGAWVGTATHDGKAETVVLDLEPDGEGRFVVRLSMPVVHLDRVAIGRFEATVRGDSVWLGPFGFLRARDARVLYGTMPQGLTPVYEIPLTLARRDGFTPPARAPLTAPAREPAWVFDAGAPIWAGPTWAGGIVYAGTDDGRLFAVEARDGTLRWTFKAGGPLRARPTVAGGNVYVQADDGFLYALDAVRGTQRWRVKIVGRPIVRLPFSDPGSRYDRFASDVTIAEGRLYVGTHDGRLVALDPADGRVLWSFATGDAVLAAPAVHAGRIYFGSYDRFVYALDAADGRLLWKRDTQGAVVSTPAIHGGSLIVGNRCYDMLALDAATGEEVWKRYIWMSWIESSATVRDGTAYVGSSDAAAVFAFDAADGGRLWAADVHGWAWGQPAVTAARVYTGTSGQVGYPAAHDGAVLALDRKTGVPVWRHAVTPPDTGAFGFPGSPAVGGGRVFAGALDGRLYAFPE